MFYLNREIKYYKKTKQGSRGKNDRKLTNNLDINWWRIDKQTLFYYDQNSINSTGRNGKKLWGCLNWLQREPGVALIIRLMANSHFRRTEGKTRQQCCGSGSARIRSVSADPDSLDETDPGCKISWENHIKKRPKWQEYYIF